MKRAVAWAIGIGLGFLLFWLPTGTAGTIIISIIAFWLGKAWAEYDHRRADEVREERERQERESDAREAQEERERLHDELHRLRWAGLYEVIDHIQRDIADLDASSGKESP
jgi:hypothetical protein